MASLRCEEPITLETEINELRYEILFKCVKSVQPLDFNEDYS